MLSAGYRDNALRRAPAPYVALAQELGLRNAGTNRDMLNADQAQQLADAARGLSAGEREQALAYAQAALSAIDGRAVPGSIPLGGQLLDHASSISPSSVWMLPSLDLFEPPEKVPQITREMIREMEQRLQGALNSFVRAEVRSEYTCVGPRILRFGILPTGTPVMANGVPRRDTTGRIVYEKRTRIEQITARQNDIQAALEAVAIRMQRPVPGTSYVGVEIPNPFPTSVPLRDVLESNEYQLARARSKLTFALGKDVSGRVHACDIARAPHLLIAGATGTGKSTLLNALIASLLTQATPDDVRLLMIDPKMVELNVYDGIPHLLRPVVVEVDQVVSLLKNAVHEMERRYRLFSELRVRNLDAYRKLRTERLAAGDAVLPDLPAIVIVIDELADLMMAAAEEVEAMICRLAQLARATGMHLVIATQRPSVDVITGLIKANIPTRIAFMVSSAVDSKTILDMGGAERLLGRGDLLYLPGEATAPVRMQGAFMTDQDAARLAAHWRVAQPSAGASIDTGHLPRLAFEEEWAGDEDERTGEEREMPLAEPDIQVIQVERDQGDEDADEQLVQGAMEKLQGAQWTSITQLQRYLRIGYARAARIMDLLAERGVVGDADGPRRSRRVLLLLPDGQPDQARKSQAADCNIEGEQRSGQALEE